MKVTVVEQSEDKMVFTLQDASIAYANSLRRLMMSDVPTMAVEEVTISKNDSVLYDEIIAHRLGLVVLKTDLDTYQIPDENRGPHNELKLSLKVEGPRTVYAKDLVSKDPKVVPVFEDTIIVKLLEGQHLELEATAILGCGKEHTKWNPGLVYYTYEPIIKVNNKHKDFASFKDKYPTQVFNAKGEIDAKLINSPSLIDACALVNPEIVSVEYDKNTIRFVVESYGALSAKTIVERAVEEFNGQVDEVQGLVKAL